MRSRVQEVRCQRWSICYCQRRFPASSRPQLLDHTNDSRQTGATEIYGAYHGGDCSLLPKKGGLKPWLHQRWCLSKVDAAFICQMEDILELYAEALESQYPIVCWDKT